MVAYSIIKMNIFFITLILINDLNISGGVRLQFYYGDHNYLRVLDEVEFWKQQESEHTTVIEQIVSELDADTVEVLHAFGQEFTQTEQKAVQLIETVIRSKNQINQAMQKHIMKFIEYAIQESEKFIQFLHQLLSCKYISQNPIYTTVINHIIRESEYFIGIAQTILFQC